MVVARLRPHGRALVIPILLLLVIAAAVPYFTPQLPETWQQIAVYSVSGALLLLGVLFPILGWLARTYTITTRRVVVRGGVLVRTRRELLHSRGTDVSLRAAGLQQLFKSGDVLLDAGSGQPVVLRDVPRANLVQSALVELMAASHNPVAERRRLQDTGDLL